MTDLPWPELGIAPTTDATAIRRAYARRLRTLKPDADPQGFARLREAYDLALGVADRRPGPPPGQGPGQPPPGPVVPRPPPPSPESATRPAPPDPAISGPDPLTEHLARHDVAAAAAWLRAAQDAGTLSLERGLQLADRLGRAMADDRSLPGPAVCAAAAALDWPESAGASDWAAPLRARLDAEAWLMQLRRHPATGAGWVADRDATAAHILLGRGPMRGLSLMRGDKVLHRQFAEYRRHAAQLADAFDPDRIEQVARLMDAPPRRRGSVRLVRLVLGLLGLCLLAGFIGGQFESSLRAGVTGTLITGSLTWLYCRSVWTRLQRWRLLRRMRRQPRPGS